MLEAVRSLVWTGRSRWRPSNERGRLRPQEHDHRRECPTRWTTYLPAGEDYLINHRALGSLVTDVFDVADAQQAFTAAFLEDAATRGKVLLRADSWQSESI